MSGKCFGCGKVGHYQDRCPDLQNKKASTKCYYCDLTGHYQDGCPKKIADEKEKAKIALSERNLEDRRWIEENLPYIHQNIENLDAIKIFLNNSPLKGYRDLFLNLTTSLGKVYSVTLRGREFFELSPQGTPLGRYLEGMNIPKFILFLWGHSSIVKLSHGVYDSMNPRSMVGFLENVNFAVRESTGKKSCETLIDGKVVMTGYDERGWEYYIKDESLILETYKRCMSNYQLEIDIIRT